MTTDQNGNTLIYDAWNRLVAVKNPSGTVIANYSYNALGYRIIEDYPAGLNGNSTPITKYLYYSGEWQTVEERLNGTANTDVSFQYVWSASYIDAMVLRDQYANGTLQSNARLYTQYDAKFNVTALIGYDSSTQTWGVVQRFVYSPYGTATVLSPTWAATTDAFNWQYMHQGGRLDPVTGLYLFRHRDYSPALGNWVEQDPLGYVDGGSRYVSLRNNPAVFLDYSGLAGQGASDAIKLNLTITLKGNIRVLQSEINVDTKTLKISGSTYLRVLYSGSPKVPIDNLESKYYANQSFRANLNASFNGFKAGGVILQGSLNIKANLDASYQGQFVVRGNVLVKPGGLIPNVRAKHFVGRVFARVADKHDGKNACHAVCTISGSGSPNFFLLRLLVPSVQVSGREESDKSTQQLGAPGIARLLKSTIEHLHATAYLLGFIPIKLN